MEKLKNILHPGKNQDDEVLYGSSQQSAHTSTAGGTDSTSVGHHSTSTTAIPVTGNSTTTTGPHSSNLANKVDPRVDSDLDGSRTPGSTTHTGTTTGGAGHGNSSANPGNYDPATTRSTNTISSPIMPRSTASDDAASTTAISHGVIGDTSHRATGLTGTSQSEEPIRHDSAGLNVAGNLEKPLPHSPTTQNIVSSGAIGTALPDRSVSSGVGSHTTGGNVPTTGSGSYGTGTAISGYNANDPSTASAGPAPHTAGPHKSDILNKLDPRVDSDLDGSRTIGSAPVAGITTNNNASRSPYSGNVDPRVDSAGSATTGHDSHRGRDAALVGGGVAAGAGAYEASKHHHPATTGTTGTGLGSSTGSTTGTSGTTSAPVSGHGSETHKDHKGHKSGGLLGFLHKDKSHDQTSTTHEKSHEHHHGRDAALVGGGAAVGAGAYEAEKHHDHDTPAAGVTGSSTTAGPHKSDFLNKADPRVDSDLDGSRRIGDKTTAGTGHHYGRDAGVAGAAAMVGTAAYEANKHHHTETDSRIGNTRTTETTGAGIGSSTTTAGPHSSSLANKMDPRVDSDLDGSRRVGDNTTTGHHYGRDAAVVGGVGATGAVAEHEHSKHDKHHDTTTQSDHKEHKSGGLLGFLHKDKSHDDSSTTHDKSHEHHHGRDAVVVGGVGVTGAVAEHEHSKHDKHHDTTTQTDHKEHKSGGLLGFLHKDKTHDTHHDTTTTTDEKHHHGTEAAAGLGAAGVVAEHEHHKHGDRNRLHKDPPTGYAAQVTGGTGTTRLAEGTPLSSGSHATGFGNRIDPATKHHDDNAGLVIEPITGLPMNVGKYGSGVGGTDANPIPGYHSGSTSTTGPTTAGPHSFDLANKADPRVDSALDGSRTTGTSATGTQHGTTGTHSTTGTY